jgi:hypothetical protein
MEIFIFGVSLSLESVLEDVNPVLLICSGQKEKLRFLLADTIHN